MNGPDYIESTSLPAARRCENLPAGSYRAIVEAIPDLIICMDNHGFFRGFSGDTDELYWPADAYLNKPLEKALPPETAELFSRKLRAVFDTGQMQYLEYSLDF